MRSIETDRLEDAFDGVMIDLSRGRHKAGGLGALTIIVVFIA